MPTIVSDGGGATATISLAEDRRGVTRVVATDPNPATITYSIIGGADQSLFQIDASTGLLALVTPPDFEAPTDADHNNSYVVQVQASNGAQVVNQTLTVNVTNINDVTGGPGPDTLNGGPSSDVLDGFGGADQLLGDHGADTFLINAPSDGVDTLRDFWLHEDVIGLDQIGFGIPGNGTLAANGVSFVVGTAATTSAPTIIYNANTMELFWDADGTGAGAPVEFARIDPGSSVVWVETKSLGSHGTDFQIAGTGDFNHDGTSDVLFRNSTTGQVDLWIMANGNWSASVNLGSHGTDYQVAGIGDFNHDGTSDVLWRNPTTGQVDLWLMANGNWSASVNLGSHGTNYQVAGIGDFNGDGTSDILWRNPTTGQVDLWLMANGNWSASVNLGSRDPSYQVAGIGDFNGDGTSDLLWRNPTTGQVDEWVMSNGNWAGSINLGSHGADWQVGGVADLNGNGTSDILWRNPTTGDVDGWVMAGGQWAGSTLYASGAPDTSWQPAATGDFNGDHVADVLWRQGTTGAIDEWHLTTRPAPDASSFEIEGNIVPNVSIPADTDVAANSVVEGAAIGTTVGLTASSTNPSGAPVTYSLSDSAGGRFAIDATSGVVRVADNTLIDFESSGAGHAYSIVVTATSGVLTSSRTFTVGVTDLAPTVPSDANAATNTVAEGAAVNTTVGLTVASTDINGPAVSYSLTGDTSGGGFKVDGSTGVVSVADPTKIDFESASGHAYTVTAQASDGTLTSSQSFTIAVTDVAPSTPVDSNGPTGGSVAEGAVNGSTVGVTALSTDPGGGQVIYTLSDSAGGRFAIDSSTGVVTVANGSLLNFESATSHQITVKAADTTGLFTTQNFTIAVTDVAPSAPTDGDATTDGVTEGAATGTAVGITASSTDINGGTVGYTLTNNAGGRFAIDPSSGVVTVANAALVNFEDNVSHSYTITVQASDGTLASTQDFVVPINDVAPAQPTDGDSATNTVAEGATTGAPVGVTDASTDVNGGALTYSFAPGGDASGRFQINSVSGVVSVSAAGAASIDYETAPGHAYSVTVQATDGTLTSTTQTFAIAVTNTPPSVPVDSDSTADNGGISGTVLEGTATGATVGVTASSTDPGGSAVTYLLTDSAGGKFAIDSGTGIVTTGPNANQIDFETSGGSYSITVQASDGAGGTSSQTFTIAVTNANPTTPSDANGASNTVAEGVASNQATGLTVQSTDPGGTTIIYSLTDDANGRFQINSSTGVVTTGANASQIDFESSGGSYSITAQASDGAGGTSTLAFLIAVSDVAPSNWSDTDAGANTISEDAADGTAVGITAQATDVNGGTVKYSFASASDSANGRFQVDPDSGVVTISTVSGHAAVDFESSGGSYNIIVTGSTVGGTATSTNPFTITVQDVAPSTPIADTDATGDSGSISGTVVEGAGATTAVGITAHTTDVNGGTITYTLSNDAGGLFTIGSSSGIVTVTAAGATGIDFESTGPGHTYSITVNASDGTLSSTQSFIIAVTDAAPSQPGDADPSANTVSTSAADNSPVGVTLSSTDPNTGAVTYALTGANVSGNPITNPFQVDASTGVVTLKPGHIDLSSFAGQSITITGVAKDPSLATSVSKDFDIFVANNQLNVDLDADDSPAGTNPGNSFSNTFTEQGAAVSIADTDVLITNAGNPGVTNATSATIVLTNAQIGDTFTFTAAAPGGIVRTVTTSAGTITVNLSGTASYTNYQTAIEQIQFSTTGDPTANAPNTTDRLIHVNVTDQTGTSPSFALSTIHITPQNDAPVVALNGSSATVNYTENALATGLLGGTTVANGTITDPDHPSDFSGGTFTVAITANAVGGQDQIVLLGGTLFSVNGTTLLHDGTAVGTISGLGGTSVSVTGFTAAATPTVVNELARAFGYQNSSDNPSTGSDRTVTFTFQDGGHTGGSAPGLANAAVVTETVHVIAVNDAPSGADKAITVGEDGSYNFTTTDFGFSDVDGNTLLAVKFTTVPSAGAGLIKDGGTTINAGDSVPVAHITGGQLAFFPATNFNGPAGFTFQVQDNGGGTDLDPTPNTITLTVTEVNDKPVANADTIGNIDEDSGAYVIPFATLTGNDSTGPANEFSQNLTVTAVSNPVGGSVQIVGNDVIFIPTANYNGAASFGYKVTDDGTSNGSFDPQTSTLSATASFTINAINDAPVNTVPFATEQVTQSVGKVISGISVSDVDAGSSNITVTLHVTNGTLTVDALVPLGLVAGDITGNGSNNVVLTGSQTAIDTTLASGNGLTYTSATLGADTLTVTTNDGGNTGSGGNGIDTDAVAIQVSPPVQTGLTGELFYVTSGSLTATDNVVGQINSNDDGTGASAIHFTATSNAVYDIGVDTVAGYYFVLDSIDPASTPSANGPTLSSYALGSGTAAHTFSLSPGDTFDSMAVDTFYDVIFVADLCSTPGDTGIKEFTYDSNGIIGDSGNYLINQTTTGSFAEAIDMTIDSGSHLLYYVNDDLATQNAIYVVDVSGTFGALAHPATTADSPPVTLLSSISQFPIDGSNGFIEAVTFDNRGTSATNDDIIYFLTSDDKLYYIVRGAGTTATLVGNAPTLTEVGAHTGLSFDPTSHQLWITNQDSTNNTDSIIKAQLNGTGTSITGTTAYDLTALTGAATPDGATVPGQTAFATLPVITVHNTSYTETNLTSTPVLIDPNFFVTDPDLLITGATITLTGGFVGSGDALAIDNTGVGVNIDSNTTDANGNITLVLSGADTPVDYFSIIRNSLTFVSGDDPTNFGHNTTRTITWHFNDGAFGDPNSDGNTKTSTITITPANDAPAAVAGSASGTEDHAIVGQLNANDVDNTPAQLSYSLVTDGANGHVTISSTGQFIYTPNADQNGGPNFDAFTFRVSDGSLTNDAVFTIDNVTAVNDAPVVTATSLTAVNEDDTNPPGDTIANLFAGANFSDVDDGAATIFGVLVSGNTANAGTQGKWQYDTHDASGWHDVGSVADATALALDAATSLRFLPAANFNGTPPALQVYGLDDTYAAGFTVGNTTVVTPATTNGGTTAISDNSVAISTSIASVNDHPALTLDLDSSSPATGADFDVSYSVSGPAVAISDTDTTITDVDNTNIVSAHVVLTNAQTNDTLSISGALPAGISATVTPGAGTITVDLSGAASLAAYQTALHQVVFNNPLAAGTPAGDRIVHVVVNDGTDDSNQATTTIHVTQDTTPTAVDDTAAITAGSATVTGTATANDTDVEDPASALVVSAVRTDKEIPVGTPSAGVVGNALVGQFGALTLNFDGTYTYQLDNNNAAVQAANSTDHLHDFFTYTVRDTAGLTDLAQIDIDITGANDPPIANPDAVSATEAGGPANTTAGVNPSGNVVTDAGPGKDTDPDNDALTVVGVALGSQAGPLSGNVNTGLHGAGASNFGTFTVQSNGSYTYVVNQTNTAVEALRTSAQTLPDTFSYTIDDGNGHTATTQVTVTIHGQDDDPVAVTDTASATEAGGTANGTAGSNPSGNVLTNDTDVDTLANGETQTVQGVAAGDVHLGPALITGVAAPIGGNFGTLTVNSNGSFGYVVNQTLADSLNSTDHPVDTFTYTMHDTDGHTSTALINVTVNGVNDAPVANNDGTFVVFENRATSPTANVLTNDTDVDTSSASFTAIKNADTAHGGTVTVNTNGTFSVSYASNSNYLGTDTFTYHTNDNGSPNLSSNAATVTLDVQPLVWHIDNSHGPDATQDGTAAHPFQSIAAFNTANAAAGAHPDIIYLHNGTGTYATTDGITLNNGQTLLGQGVDLTYTKTDTTLVTLLDADNSQIPTITASAGSAVHLASGNTIAGFNVGNTTAAGIVDNGSSVGNLAISNIAITDTGSALSITHGGTLSIDTAHGGVTTQSFQSVTSSNSTGEGISLSGGAGTLGGSLVIGTTSVTDATGNAIHVSNTAANASFNFGNTTVNDTVVGGHTGNGINLVTGIGATNTFTFSNISDKTDGGYGLTAVGGTLSIGGSSSTIDAHGGAAVDLTGTSLTAGGAHFISVSSAGSSTYGINLVNQTTGTFFASGGTIGTADTAGVHISGGTAAANMSTAINSSNGEAVDISGHSSGDLTFGGAITHTSNTDIGINVGSNTSGTITFGGQTAITTTTAAGVNLTSNTGATIQFNASGNGLDITTGSGNGFTATGGGTVFVQGSGNSIHTGSGVALNIANTTIGASNVTFHDIADNGGSSGIVLNNTGASGSLIVTGDGNTSLGGNSSGGTIQNTTGNGISLTSTRDASFTNMNIQSTGDSGINGFGVTNFTLANSTINNSGNALLESNIAFNNSGAQTGNSIAGTLSITGNTLTNAYFSGIDIQADNGTVTNATITGNSIVSPTSAASTHGSGIDIAGTGNASTAFNIDNATISNNTITNWPTGDGINFSISNSNAAGPAAHGGVIGNNSALITISGNTIHGQSAANPIANQGIAVVVADGSSANRSQINAVISNNDIQNTFGSSIITGANGYADIAVTVSGNTIVGVGEADVGGPNGIAVGAGVAGAGNAWTPHVTAIISNNNISQTDGNGILAVARGASGELDIKINNNTVATPTNAGGTAREGIRVDAGNAASADDAVFLNIFSNTSSGSNGAAGIGVRKNGTVATTNDFGVFDAAGGPSLAATPTNTDITNFINALNPASTGGTDIISGSNYLRDTTHAPPLLAAAGGIAAAPGQDTTGVENHLTQSELDAITTAAIARWAAAGLSADQVALLQQVTVTVGDLPALVLGQSDQPGHITISTNAAGYGWFVDPTPNDDGEFAHAANSSGTDLYTDPTAAPAGHMDLLTTVAHELGHQISLEDSADTGDATDLMYVDLVAGERRLPDSADVLQSQKADAIAAAQAAETALPAGAAAQTGTVIVPGSAGDDTFHIGAGGTIVAGGEGADTFVFDASVLAASPTTPITHIADYSAAQGDVFDFSALQVADAAQVRAVEDASDAFATLQIEIGGAGRAQAGGPAAGAHWVSVAQVDGMHAGDAIDVVLNPTQVAHLHSGLFS